ncbi:hypothetical protein NDU88_002980 [Pleurodeles waltl]|uniref:Uncharacterized protein n=1 Tax=Pleurodeles waltl TaxID=8319 RepID=A0AAV7UX71_PLEWA|nr:hypothetical protein NDU88_002980 [Pleurodeles waltl]
MGSPCPPPSFLSPPVDLRCAFWRLTGSRAGGHGLRAAVRRGFQSPPARSPPHSPPPSASCRQTASTPESPGQWGNLKSHLGRPVPSVLRNESVVESLVRGRHFNSSGCEPGKAMKGNMKGHNEVECDMTSSSGDVEISCSSDIDDKEEKCKKPKKRKVEQ